MGAPVVATTLDLALEEQARDVAGVFEGYEQKIHRLGAARSNETETRKQHDRLAALMEEDGQFVHRFYAREILRRFAHDEPP